MIPVWLRPAFGAVMVLLAIATALTAKSHTDWVTAAMMLIVGLVNLLWAYISYMRRG